MKQRRNGRYFRHARNRAEGVSLPQGGSGGGSGWPGDALLSADVERDRWFTLMFPELIFQRSNTEQAHAGLPVGPPAPVEDQPSARCKSASSRRRYGGFCIWDTGKTKIRFRGLRSSLAWALFSSQKALPWRHLNEFHILGIFPDDPEPLLKRTDTGSLGQQRLQRRGQQPGNADVAAVFVILVMGLEERRRISPSRRFWGRIRMAWRCSTVSWKPPDRCIVWEAVPSPAVCSAGAQPNADETFHSQFEDGDG